MRFLNLTTVVTCLLVLTPAAALPAHEGHGAPGAQDGILHYVANPSHSIPLVIITAAVIWSLRKLLRTTPKHSR